MAIEWKPELNDVDIIKNDIVEGIEQHGMSKTMLYHEIDQLEEKAQTDLKHLESEVKTDSNQWSEHSHAPADAQGYINDHYHEKLYSETHAESDAFFQKNKHFIYDYAEGINTLEIMKEDNPTLGDAIDNALEDIQKTDDELLEKEVSADYNLDAQNNEFKDDKDLEKYPKKYKEYYQSYKDAITEKNKAVGIIDKHNKSYDEIKRDHSFQHIELHSQFTTDLNLVISGNEEALKKYNLERGINPVDAYTEVGFIRMNHFTPDDFIEKENDLATYQKATENLENNVYGKEYLNEISKHNSNIFLKNLNNNRKGKELGADYEKSTENIKDIKIEDMTFNYDKLKNEKVQDFTVLHDAESLDITFNNQKTMNIFQNSDEKKELNQQRQDDRTIGDFIQDGIDIKNQVKTEKMNEQEQKNRKTKNIKNNIEL